MGYVPLKRPTRTEPKGHKGPNHPMRLRSRTDLGDLIWMFAGITLAIGLLGWWLL